MNDGLEVAGPPELIARVRVQRAAAIARMRVLDESRGQCNICESRDFLQIAAMRALSLGGEITPSNLIAVCPICHSGIDSNSVPPDLLESIKREWVENRVPGKERLLAWLRAYGRTPWGALAPQAQAAFALSLGHTAEFDERMRKAAAKLRGIKSETDFLRSVLKPLLEALQFEAVTVLHHTGRSEQGKDIVFYERNRLGGFTWYAVVACIGDIHASSSRTQDSGHYAKIEDQVRKCFLTPYTDQNLKASSSIDKVVVCCTGCITPDAADYLRIWEDRNNRRLLFLEGDAIMGHVVRLEYTTKSTARGR